MIKETKKLTKYQLKAAFEYFNDLFNKPGQNPVYSMFVYANHEILLPHYISLQRAVYNEANDPQWHEFNRKGQAIQMKYADKNEDGSPKLTEKGEPIVVEHRDEAMSELTALQDEYKELIVRLQNKNKTNDDLYNQVIELEVVTLTPTQFINDAPPYIVGQFVTGAI